MCHEGWWGGFAEGRAGRGVGEIGRDGGKREEGKGEGREREREGKERGKGKEGMVIVRGGRGSRDLSIFVAFIVLVERRLHTPLSRRRRVKSEDMDSNESVVK